MLSQKLYQAGACALILFASSSYAELVTYRMEASVESSAVTGIETGSSASIELRFDNEATLSFSNEYSENQSYYAFSDGEAASGIELSFNESELSFSTPSPWINVNNFRDEISETWYNSISMGWNSGSSSDGQYSNLNMNIFIGYANQASALTTAPETLETIDQFNPYTYLDISDENNNQLLRIRVSSFEEVRNRITASISPINTTVPSTGGEINFSREFSADADEQIIFNRSEYVVFPDGFIYTIANTEDETWINQAISSEGYIFVPQNWPSGTYQYVMNYITLDNAERSSVSFEFTKE